MIGLQSIGAILSDPELRKMLGKVASRKISADLKTLEAHAELSRRLSDNRQNARLGNADALKHIIREHLEYYETLVELSYTFHERLLHLLQEMGRGGDAGAVINGLTLNLSAPVGAIVRAPFKVTNNRAEAISVTCRASPFVSEDGSQLIASPVGFDPPGGEIQAGSEQTFEAVIAVSPDFRTGRTYLATLSADGIEAMQIVTRLTIEESPPKAAEAPPPSPASTVPADVMPEAAGPASPSPSAPQAQPNAEATEAAKSGETPPAAATVRDTDPSGGAGARPHRQPKARARR